MKKRVNILFFGSCFLAALLAEAYCFEVLNGDLVSTVGIGIVVLITGYLFMDTIASIIKLNMDNAKFYTDRIIREETDKWDERYTELVNLQKATYAATKKNTMIFTEQMKDVLTLLENMENSNVKELRKIVELQKRSMEGQKNALNMEINYNRENTKQLISVLREEGNRPELIEQLSKVLALLETNNELLSTRISSIGNTDYTKNDHDNEVKKDYDVDNEFDQDSYLSEEEDTLETAERSSEDIYAKVNDTVEYNYENDYLTQDSNEPKENYSNTYFDEQFPETDETVVQAELQPNNEIENEYLNLDNATEYINIQPVSEEITTDNYITQENTAEEVITKEPTAAEIFTEENLGVPLTIETAPELLQKEETEAVDKSNNSNSTSTEEITPLYADPNKALSADEIAALFASFGQ